MFKLAKWAVGKGCGGRTLRPVGRSVFALEGLEGRRMMAGNEGGLDLSINVDFPDANLEAAVRETLNKPSGPITVGDMQGMKDFAPTSRGITNLSGLEFAVNLESLHLNDNQIVDISPLAGLSKLEEIWLPYNRVVDISPVANKPNLWRLYASDNQISVIPPLEGLNRLAEVFLSSNRIEDISNLAMIPSLGGIDVGNNPISDITPLAGLTRLEMLSVTGTRITDISALAGLTELRNVNLGSTEISDISVLAGLWRLRTLYLPAPVTEISALSGLAHVINLDLGGTQVRDLTPLTGFVRRNALGLNLRPAPSEAFEGLDEIYYVAYYVGVESVVRGNPGNDVMRVMGRSTGINGPPGGGSAGTNCIVSDCEGIKFHGLDGDDLLELRRMTRVPYTFYGGAGLDTLRVMSNGDGVYEANLGEDEVELVKLESGAKLQFRASQDLMSLELKGSSQATVVQEAGLVMTLDNLLMDEAATLDLADGSLILHATPETRSSQLITMTALIASARNGGAWNEPGITSSLAAQSNGLTTLGILLNDDGTGQPIYTEFAGRSVGVNDILIRYTYAGDLDLNGVVDADDYFRIDTGYAAGGLVGGAYPTWFNGDINYDSKIDGDDYFLIDTAFAEQASLLSWHSELLQ